MNAIKQLFAGRVQRKPRIDFRALLKTGYRDIGKSAGAVLVLTLILITALGLYWIASNALTTMQMTHDARQDLLNALERRAEAAGLKGHAEGRRGNPFFSASTETLAASQLDDELRRVVGEEHGIVLSSHAQVEHDDQSRGNKIEIKTIVETKIDEIQALLFRLETSDPAIFVEELNLEPKNDDTQGGSSADPTLHANMTLAAYWQDPTRKRVQK